MTLDQLRPHLTRSGSPGLDPIPDLVLRGDLGVLPVSDGSSTRCRTASTRSASIPPWDGHLTYGECYLPGETEDEVLISCHVCHPSLANDNLLAGRRGSPFMRSGGSPPISYRFLFIPGTIGSITWLARNEDRVADQHGLVLACVGDRAHLQTEPTGRCRDRSGRGACSACGVDHELVDFSPYGYDERQYCSPGFDFPVGASPARRMGYPNTTPPPTTSSL